MQSIGRAKRWRKGKRKQNIQQCAVIVAYNRGMGGVDLPNHALSDLRPVIFGEKMVLTIGHKWHQYCICIQLAVVSYCFW